MFIAPSAHAPNTCMR